MKSQVSKINEYSLTESSSYFPIYNTLILLIITSIFFCSCRTLPRGLPRSSDSAAVVVQIDDLFFITADKVYFAKIDEGSDLSKMVIQSTFTSRDRVYLLDPKPGKYMIVGYYYEINAFAIFEIKRYMTLGETAMRQSVFTVEPGELKLLGNIEVGGWISDRDEKYAYYYAKLINPNASVSIWSALWDLTLGNLIQQAWKFIGFDLIGIKTQDVGLGGNPSLMGFINIEEIENDEETIKDMREEVKGDLIDSAWRYLVQ